MDCSTTNRFDFSYELFKDRKRLPQSGTRQFRQYGDPELLFWRQEAKTLQALQGAKLVFESKFASFLYPLTGGFGYRSFIPQSAFSFLVRVDDVVSRIFGGLTAMRMMVVLEKTEDSSNPSRGRH